MTSSQSFDSAVFRIPIVFLLTTSALVAGLSISQPEATVRAAYASVVLASQVGSILNSPAWELGDQQLSIRIEGVHTGPISEVLDSHLSDQVTIPSGDVLQIGPGMSTFNGHHLATTVQVGDWRPANTSYGGTERLDWNTTFRRALQGLRWHPSSFAGFTVLVSAHGRERRYKAMFLFENIEGGPPNVRIIDYILGSSTLDTVMHSSLAKEIRSLPCLIRNLVVSSQQVLSDLDTRCAGGDYGLVRSSGASKLFESVRAAPDCVPDPVTELCCDSVTGQCGIKR